MKKPLEYTRSLDTLRFTAEQKAAIAEQVVASAQKEHRRPIRRMTLIAAAVVMLVAVGTAGATGAFKSAVESFSGLFGVAQTEIIEKIGRPIGASATDNGITITADAIIGDQYNACIIYTIARTDQEPLLPKGIPVNALQCSGSAGSSWGDEGGRHGSSYFRDDKPSDNAVQYVQTVSSDTPINKGTAKANFDDFSYWDEASDTLIPLVSGHWKFRFDIAYEDSAITLGGGAQFQQDGMTFTVDEITLSPIAVRVAYTVDSEVQWSHAPAGRQDPEDSRQSARYLENVKILLTKTDGTVLDLNTGGSISTQDGSTACVKSTVLNTLIPLDQLESISVGGIVYSIHN
ncbi:MAG: DUF4179 domain-containing protein [Evtepia sp.]